MGIIEVRELVKRYGDIAAVDGISFDVEEGETFGFLGPNGAGKTTTISILCTLLKPTSGSATLNGYDVSRQQHEVRQSIGLIFQDPSLDDRLTAAENLEFHGVLYNIPRKRRKERIDELLRLVGLEDRRDSQVRTFSGGMRRRLEIARGLMHFPRVLFLDEPTIGLDPQTRKHIWEHIQQLRQREKITIFLTTHYMDEANNADRIAIIDQGKIVALDTPDKLKRMVGGDVIIARTADDAAAAQLVREKFGLPVKVDQNGLQFEVPNGEQFIPSFITGIGVEILAVSLRRPTLDDVFLKLTGRQIRDEDSDGAMDMRRQFVRAHVRRRG